MAKVSGQRGYYKQQILKLTGWTSQEYTKKYDIFKHKVRNFNIISGQNLSPAEQFYYKLRADKKARANNEVVGTNYNFIQTTLNKMSSQTKSVAKTLENAKIEKLAAEHILTRFAELSSDKNPNEKYRTKFAELKEAYESGQLSLAEYNKQTTALANQYNKEKRNANENGLIGSQ